MNFIRKQSIEAELVPGRALVIYGPRRVGKTYLLRQYLNAQSGRKVLSVVGDDIRVRELFSSQVRDDILDFAAPYDIVAIDEAQYVPRIGLGAKMIVDAFPEKTLLLTGSSSIDLSSEVGEPLTGRHYVLTLYPIADSELSGSNFDAAGTLEERLIYGSYPEVLLAPNDSIRERILNELISSYLYKDVLALERIKSPEKLRDLVKMLAFQVGNEVSQNKLATELKIDVKTVDRYLDLLEKMFVIVRVQGYSRNLRNEITQKSKYYFLDNGVRNAVIGAWAKLTDRDDIGKLWENFLFTELLKTSALLSRTDQYYFWRTYDGKEVDIIRESHGELVAIECKWRRDGTFSKLWREAYPASTNVIITRENYRDVIRNIFTVPSKP